MQELQKQLKELQVQIQEATTAIGLDKLISDYQALLSNSQESDFWADPSVAQEVMKRLSALEKRIKLWETVQKTCDDLLELMAFGDDDIEDDLQRQYMKLKHEFEAHKNELSLSGPYDQQNVIMDIHAGAGGTDAQDWASMLLRMYIRWAENHDFITNTLASSPGEEAGLKSATLEIRGPLAYGLLKSEHGVHRLVRQSPFNADSLRQTSFAKVSILPEIDKPGDLVLDEKDLKIDVYRAGGHGGQSVNTTDSAVRITHVPTGATVSIQNERSQLQNKETAMTILRSKLAAMQLEQHKEKIEELKGPNTAVEWGSQIRSYVLHPYKQVKDLRTKHETTDVQAVLDGKLDDFIDAYLDQSIGEKP